VVASLSSVLLNLVFKGREGLAKKDIKQQVRVLEEVDE
jgi:xanthine permease